VRDSSRLVDKLLMESVDEGMLSGKKDQTRLNFTN
jgi:hypothetical protein